ncbi:MAG: hypothetical protein JW751_20250 [Polyangiaceae bacterium]|nr:hypothetical protein [Polyangiaceae bacterium]
MGRRAPAVAALAPSASSDSRRESSSLTAVTDPTEFGQIHATVKRQLET